MAGIVQRLPFPLTGRTDQASATFALSGVQYDYALGGLPFLSAINDQNAMTRTGAPMKKDQFDNQEIPGEQSLASWWLRSQSTFIGGAGLLYQDPSVDNQYAIKFGESTGVNPWVNGKASLLRSTAQQVSDATTKQHSVVGWSDGDDHYYSGVGSVLTDDDGTTQTEITWGGTGDIVSLASDGSNYYAADATSVYSGAGTGDGSAVWDTGSADVVLGWVKGRLMAGIDNKVYELVGSGAPTLPDAKFTHLNADWVWTAFAEGPDSIYASGYAGAVSTIYRFVLDTSGSVPTLASGGITTAQLPQGEVVYSMTIYLGSFVGIGTSRGFRVGQIDSSGNISYGPLLFEVADGVKAIAGYDRFFYVGASGAIDGDSGLYRVDLGQPLTAQGSASPSVRFAYATDLQAHVSGEVCSVTTFGTSDRMVFAVVGSGSYLESASELEETGTISTGRIRYNTLEPKIFKFISVKTPATQAGSVSVTVGDPGGGSTSIITVHEGSAMSIEDVLLKAPAGPAEWIQITFTLTRSDEDTTTGGVIEGWQLKAMPGGTRQRQITIPFECFDKEKDRSGQYVGYTGRCHGRLRAFETLFAKGDSVSFQELAVDESTLVVIDDYRFEQKAAPSAQSGYGGVLWVQLRTIADVV